MVSDQSCNWAVISRAGETNPPTFDNGRPVDFIFGLAFKVGSVLPA